MKFFSLLFLLNLSFASLSQMVFFQDTYKGGATAGGFSTGLGIGSGLVQLNIEPGSTIRKSFLFAYSSGIFTSENISINGVNYNFNSLNSIVSVNNINNDFNPLNLHCIDITNELNFAQTSSFLISIDIQDGMPSEGVFAPFIYIAYENSNLLEINSTLIINTQDFDGNENYSIDALNPINSNHPVGFSIYSDRSSGDGIAPSKQVFFSSNLLGLIGGSDAVNPNWSFAGVKGHFYYQNNQLFGLDDDTSDPVMSGSDGLADVSSYLSNNSTSCNFQLIHINYPNQAVNLSYLNFAYFLSYTSPCSEFPIQTSTDTTLCQGANAQLFASGGQSYSWQPTTGLSCTDCPNPIVTADSSRLYTVRIWNNDSCSVVRPIKVNVQPLPQFSGVGSTPTACGENTGSAIAVAQNTTPLPLSYSINGAPFAFSSTYTGNFVNLSAGANTIILRDAFGCERDTVIQIGVTNTTNAFFTATPNSGAAPLSVSFTNQSTNATNYSWFIESDFVGDNLLQHTFDTSGSYTVTLIAWQNDPLCADTFSIQILAYDSLIIQIPNVFTPNGDGINDQFTITTNQPVTVEYQLFNRWGNVIAQDTKPTTAGNSNFVLPIWDGAGYSDGTYFYVIRVVHDGKEYEFDGFLERIE